MRDHAANVVLVERGGISFMVSIRKQSKWKFETSAGLGTGFSAGEFLALSAGKSSFIAVAPEGDKTKFHYVSAGAGVGVGAKVSIAGSDESSLSVGRIYILDSFKGDELEYSDIAGMCIIVEASVGIFNGGAGTMMLLGIPETFRGIVR